MQIWDHNADGTITFNLLYTFERENRIVQKEVFEEHYHPFPLELVKGKLLDMGYQALDLKPVPCNLTDRKFDKIDWYRIIAQKKERKVLIGLTQLSGALTYQPFVGAATMSRET